ncbi:divergent polysaccharide deacetylase family protein [Roseomonas sp. SSH11]|uniref:Divergent polysaccharide deacetylase family protein n=1 Tax=Pararoseomonas baculiformis TaxID=2820812 RepID=A0ABS4AJS6_9PROT|nr:divergent polysaccharide deacetylase family protein [Pararoseomonas baculiformis]MBP0447109.1 divergent polysaccharide deacetylase family protein [Pararoseomonas baculiformis]
MKALGVFWLLLAASLGTGAYLLHRAGPPEGGIPASLTRSPGASRGPVAIEDAGMPPGAAPPATAPEPAAPPQAAADEKTPPVMQLASPAPPEAPSTPPGAASQEAPATPTIPPSAALPPPPAPVVAALPSAPEPPPLPVPARRPEPSADRPIPPPDPALQELSRHGPLPRLGAEGRTSIRYYGRPFDRADTRPRIALVIGNLGLSGALSEEAIRRLPPETSLAFSPYGSRPAPLLERARARGMEVLSALPLEPASYPVNDPGDRALLTSLPPAENADRLAWVLSRIAGQVGAIGALGPMRGERFAALPEAIGGVQDVLRDRGLLYIDPRPGAPNPARAWGRAVDLVVDEPATRTEIDRRLTELERIARERGSALGLAADVSPVLVDRVAAWAAGLEERGLVMAPVTALIRRPDDLPRN